MDFRWFMKTSKKKKSLISQQTDLYIQGQGNFVALWSFILYLLQRFALSLKHNHYVYTPFYMHTSLYA